MGHAIVGAVIALLWTLAATAQAQDSPQPGEDAYRRGLDAFAGGRFTDAAGAFEACASQTTDDFRRAMCTEMTSESRRRAAEPPVIPPPPPGDTVPPPPGPGTELGAPGEPPETPPAPAEEPRSGAARNVLLGGGTLAALGFYGWALPLSLGLEPGSDSDTRLFVGAYMLTVGTTFFLPFLLTMEEDVTWGMTSHALYGSFYGLWHGAFLYGTLFNIGEAEDEGQGLLGTMLLVSLGESIANYFWARESEMDAGRVHAIATGGFEGAALAFGLEMLFVDEFDDDASQPFFAGLLLGTIGGMAGGLAISHARDWTWGDVHLIETAGIFGSYIAAMPWVLAEAELGSDSTRRGFVASLIAGNILGLIVGDRLTDGRDLESGQGFLVWLGTVAGMGAGAGLAFVAFGDDGDGKPIITASVLGGAGGFALTYLVQDFDAEGGDDTGDFSAVFVPTFGEHGELGGSIAGTF